MQQKQSRMQQIGATLANTYDKVEESIESVQAKIGSGVLSFQMLRANTNLCLFYSCPKALIKYHLFKTLSSLGL